MEILITINAAKQFFCNSKAKLSIFKTKNQDLLRGTELTAWIERPFYTNQPNHAWIISQINIFKEKREIYCIIAQMNKTGAVQ